MAQDLPERSVVQNLANAPAEGGGDQLSLQSLIDLFYPAFNLESSTVGAAILLGVLAFIGTVIVRSLKWLMFFGWDSWTNRRLRKNAYIDFLLSAQAAHKTAYDQVNEAALESKFAAIEREKDDPKFRFFGGIVNDQEPINSFRRYRSYFRQDEMMKIDSYLFDYELFIQYYNLLCLKEYSELSHQRKKAAVEVFGGLGRDLIASAEALLDIPEFCEQDKRLARRQRKGGNAEGVFKAQILKLGRERKLDAPAS